MSLRRFWLRFAIAPGELTTYTSYAGLSYGCGVTAHNYDDAINLLRSHLFRGDPLPEISEVVEDVDVSRLDAGHVRPNMGDPSRRGIWFPAGID
jgi:hypothetical protein